MGGSELSSLFGQHDTAFGNVGAAEFNCQDSLARPDNRQANIEQGLAEVMAFLALDVG
jgi:hypothetical protein